MMPWRSLLARSTAAGAILSVFVAGAAFIGVKLAGADPGGPPTRHAFTFAGVLSNPDGGPTTSATMLRFVFRRMGAPDCTPTPVRAEPNSHGAFSVPVPIDGCGTTFFNGTDVSYDVFVVGEDAAVASNVAITPVPYARFADQAGVNNDCPVGYERVFADGFPSGDMTPRRLCRRPVQGGAEDVVRVGMGAGAFWIDRFEATVNTQQNAGGTYYFDAPASASTVPEAPSSFPANGQWGTMPFPARPYSLSVSGGSGRPPARGITWFQASEACAASGKVLPSRMQWLLAAQGTQDRGCNLGGEPRLPGGNLDCVSYWGALDMNGNLWEWTDEWYAGAGSSLSLDLSNAQPRSDAGVPSLAPALVNVGGNPWPAGYGDDTTYNVNAFTQRVTTNVSGLPAAAARGGSRSIGNAAGVFALLLIHAPSSSATDLGFRCVIPR